MSELRATTLSDAAGTGPTELTGQSAAKAWVNLSSAAVVTAGYNVSSGTDNGTGDYQYTFSNAMAGTLYAPVACERGASADLVANQTISASVVEVSVWSTTPAATDRDTNHTVMGDLA